MNIFYTQQYFHLKNQSDEIVHLMFQEKLNSGKFPKTIKLNIDSRITYQLENDNQFTLSFFVANKNSGHFYSSKSGWGFMDD